MKSAATPFAAGSPALRRPLGEVAASYLALTKPRVLPLVIFSALPALVMASGGWPAPGRAAAVILGIALAAAAASTFNCWVERDRDRLMERTRTRPLPRGEIAPGAALAFGLVLAAAATALLAAAGSLLAAALGVASILFYVFVYTLWLKPRSAWSTEVGAATGAVAPLIADAAVDGRLGAPGLLLFAIVFCWQPPHVWAIALFRKRDYERAGLPMGPSVWGEDVTCRRMLAYTLVLVPVTLAPVALGLLGPLYLAVAGILGAWFVAHAVVVLRVRTPEAARRMFQVSLAHLFLLFLAMLPDLAGVLR